MIGPSAVDFLGSNVGALALLVYLVYEIRFGRVADALETMEDRIERNSMAVRFLGRGNPNVDETVIDGLVDHDGDLPPTVDEAILNDTNRWADTRTPADGEEDE